MLALHDDKDKPVSKRKLRRRRTAGAIETNLQEEALDKGIVAEIPSSQIPRMTRDELIRMVRAVHVVLPQPHVADKLELCDRRTLERLAHLARRCCRNQGY